MKFIAVEHFNPYIKYLSKFLDIDVGKSWKELATSEKNIIMWNPYAYLLTGTPSHKNKYDLYMNRSKPIYVVERGALPESIFVDKNGFLFDSKSYNEQYWNRKLSTDELKKVKEYIANFTKNNDSLELQHERINPIEFLRRTNIDSTKLKIFVPLQVHNDTTTLLWCDWVKNVENFKNIIKQLAEEEDCIFLVKNHPTENTKYHMKESKNIKIVDNFHYKDCIEYSDAVLTINSSIGLQAMMWTKPVMVVGKAFYYFWGVNHKATGINCIKSFLHSPLYPDMDKVYRFIHYLKYEFYTHCIIRKTGHNRSEPTLIDRVVIEKPNAKDKVIL